jgi:hypothetical protein
MLHFESLDDFIYEINRIRELESDSNVINKVFQEWNIDFNQKDTLVTSNPICEREEKKFQNFLSARKKEESEVFKKLSKGENTFTLIKDPYLKTFLNEENSVKIGNRYFKVYSDGLVLIVDKDFNLFKKLSKLENIKDVRQSESVSITNTELKSWNKKISFEERRNNTSQRSTCVIPSYLIDIVEIGPGDYRVEYIGPNSYDLYQWTFSLGIPTTGNPAYVYIGQHNGSTGFLELKNLDQSAPGGYRLECSGGFNIPPYCGKRGTKWDLIANQQNNRRLECQLDVTTNVVQIRSAGFRKNFWGNWVSYSTQIDASSNAVLKNGNTCQIFGENISGPSGNFPTAPSITRTKTYSFPIFGVVGGMFSNHILIDGGTTIQHTLEL